MHILHVPSAPNIWKPNKQTRPLTTMAMMLVLNDIIDHLLASKLKAWLIKPTPKQLLIMDINNGLNNGHKFPPLQAIQTLNLYMQFHFLFITTVWLTETTCTVYALTFCLITRKCPNTLKVSKHFKSVRRTVCQFLFHMFFALLSPLPSLDVWEWQVYLTIKSSRSHQGRVQYIRPVSTSQHHNVSGCIESQDY